MSRMKSLLLLPLLLAPFAGSLAQDASPEAPSVPAAAGREESASAPLTVQSQASPVAPAGVPAQPSIQSTTDALQTSLPAGVCPVITDYLYQQCQQSPDDPMCAQVSVD
jgi:hypothetical protein